MIDWDATYEKYGYREEDLSRTSTQKVIWVCDNPDCQAPHDQKKREFTYDYARKKREKCLKEHKLELCTTCSHAHRVGKKSKKTGKNKVLDLPPQVNEEKTYEKYGHYAKDLKGWSRKRVVLDCDCGKECETTRAQLNTYKSIKETGNFKCIGCYTRDRRKGIKLSDEQKEELSKSQQLRREREKDRQSREIRKFLDEYYKKQNQEDNVNK